MEKKLRKRQFDLEDLRGQLKSLNKMGPLQQVMEMIPGAAGAMQGDMDTEAQKRRIVRMGAIIDSMTPQERRHPKILNGSRRKRIARGSGTSVEEINLLLRQYGQMRKLMKRLGKADARTLKRQLGMV